MGITYGAPIGFLCLCTLLVGCSKTQYVNYGAGEKLDQTMSRAVEFEVHPAFYETPINCVIVLEPDVGQDLQQFALPVERAFSRHLSERVPRVIAGSTRNTAARQLAYDLSRKADLEQLADEIDCGTVLMSRVVGPGHTFLLVWSRIRIGIEGRLVRISDGAILWQARHMTGRSDGGIPLSPVGFVSDVYSSASLVNDDDTSASIADDGVRRIMQSLPILHSASDNLYEQ